jgi:anti-sigma factor RsiW
MKTKNIVTTQDMEQLSALLDGELSATKAATLRQRMQTDATLQAAYTEIALTQDAMRTMPTLKPPRSLRIDPQRLHQARGWRWWLISPPGGQLFPTLGVAMSLCFCLLFGAVALQPAESPVLKGAVTSPALEAAPADESALSVDAQLAESPVLKGAVTSPALEAAPADESALSVDAQLIAPDALPLAGSPWAWLGVAVGAGVLGGTVRWSWQIRGRKRAVKR